MALSSLIFEKTFKAEPVPDMTPEPFTALPETNEIV